MKYQMTIRTSKVGPAMTRQNDDLLDNELSDPFSNDAFNFRECIKSRIALQVKAWIQRNLLNMRQFLERLGPPEWSSGKTRWGPPTERVMRHKSTWHHLWLRTRYGERPTKSLNDLDSCQNDKAWEPNTWFLSREGPPILAFREKARMRINDKRVTPTARSKTPRSKTMRELCLLNRLRRHLNHSVAQQVNDDEESWSKEVNGPTKLESSDGIRIQRWARTLSKDTGERTRRRTVNLLMPSPYHRREVRHW